MRFRDWNQIYFNGLSKTKKAILCFLAVGIVCAIPAVIMILNNREREPDIETVTPVPTEAGQVPDKNKEENPSPTPTLTPKEVVEQQTAASEYVVEVGEDVTYTFHTDGTLTVSGTGATMDFTTADDGREYLLNEIFQEATGEYPVSSDELAWCQQALDRVTEIVIEEGITEVGQSAFGMFFSAETVELPESLEEVGVAAFMGTGQNTGKEVSYTGKDREKISQDTTSFLWITREVIIADFTSEQTGMVLRRKEEQGTIPDASLLESSIRIGDGTELRLYTNGVLVMEGGGATYDFKSQSDYIRYVMEELHTKSRTEVKEQWFDRVVEIYITGEYEKLGSFCLAEYRKAALVTVDGTIEAYGRGAFFNCTSQAVEEPVWYIDLTGAEVEENSFHNCRNVKSTEYQTEE